MRNRFFITTAIIFVITIIFAQSAQQRKREVNEKQMHIVSESQNIQRQEISEPDKPQTNEVKDLITKKEINNLRMKTPLKEDFQAEVRENPHQTPPSLVSFATLLGRMSEKAQLNVTNADIFMNELDDCTSNDKIAESARALCLSKAEGIAKRFPTLSEKFKGIQDRAPASIGITVKKQRSLLKKTR